MSQGKEPEERRHSTERKSSKRDRSSRDEEESQDADRAKTRTPKLNLNDLGAGYNQDDKKVTKAIKNYEECLLPFVLEHEKLFARSGFLEIPGYGTNIKDMNDQSHRSTPINEYTDDHRDGSYRFHSKRPRYST